MIRFCDKEAYSIQLGEMTRSQMLMFFLKSEGKHMFDIIIVYDKDEYIGIVTYQRLLKYQDEINIINRDLITISENFWKEAHTYFMDNANEIVPVCDCHNQILGFAYNEEDVQFNEIYECLKVFEQEKECPVDFDKFSNGCSLICISDINELAYLCYKLFKKLGYCISVLGEKWEWFGIEQLNAFYDIPEYQKFYIYAEGSACTRKKNEYISRKSGIIYQFGFLLDWADANMEYIYNQKIKMLGNYNVKVCRCLIPEMKEIEVLTKDEIISSHLATDAYAYDKLNYTTIKKDNLKSLLGEHEFKALENGELFRDDNWGNFDFNSPPLKKIKGAYGKKKIYIVGPCLVLLGACFMEDNLSYLLQMKVAPFDYEVVVVMVPRMRFDLLSNAFNNFSVNCNDIFLIVDSKTRLKKTDDGLDCVDLIRVYNNEQREAWIMNMYPLHVNKKAHRVIADEIYDKYLKNVIDCKKDRDVYIVQKGKILDSSLEEKVIAYCQKIKRNGEIGDVGSIVMNCNPFTYGHQYLIEYAASKVDLLYVFVVEENKSEFDFNDRFEMVKRGTAHLSNVAIVPSGEWVLSFNTLPIYFEKSVKKEARADAELDLQIFARYIAPQLGISIRFVGEEPIDKITKQYNEQMHSVLNAFDIEVEEISRKQCDGEVISASAVRGFMKYENWDMVRKYVPESTYEYIRNMITQN